MKFDALTPNTLLAIKLCLISILMLVFALFLMPPLYNVFCDITGLNGKTENKAYSADRLEQSISPEPREVTVQFVTNNNASMPWVFKAVQGSIHAKIGESYKVNFYVKNTTNREMKAQAIPSVSPFSAADFLKKIECFCFQQQTLKPGESAELPLYFKMDSKLPNELSKITLSYTLFDITRT